MANGMVFFLAELYLRSQGQGGRATPITSGFRTDMKFKDQHRMVVVEFNEELLFPGRSCPVTCAALLHGESEIDYIESHPKTVLADGGNVIGDITVKEVLNRDGIIWR